MSTQELQSEESNRMWASASFVGILIIIGLPLWWKTTEVYRVSLPYDKINSFDPLSHYVTTELTVVAEGESTASQVATHVENAFKDSDVIKLKIKTSVLSDGFRSALSSVSDEKQALEVAAKTLNLERRNNFYIVQNAALKSNEVWLAGERIAFFRDPEAVPLLVEVLKRYIYQTTVLQGARSETADAARRTRFPPDEGYHIVLSVVNPRPDALTVQFDAAEAVEDYFGSFVDELSALHNFTLKSQWLYLLDFDFRAVEVIENGGGRHWSVRADRLPQLVTRLEERAATRVSAAPALNLALYAVPCARAPLRLYTDRDEKIESPVQAFMSPKWGGVVLGNPTSAECEAESPVWRPDVRLIMGAFISHLRKLLGIVDVETINGVNLVPLRSVVPRRWEVDALLRLRAVEQVSSAERTLQSLGQLLGKISNIVINDEVGGQINTAVDSIVLADKLLTLGHLEEAYRVSQRAYLAAETAFMDPSLLALLYFPDDQKYAIYIPLFLPIMFPVVLSLKNLMLWLRGKPLHKEKTD